MGGYIGARAGSLSITTVANAQDITATDTTPEVTIINNTHEDSDGGREGKVIFKGQQSGGEESTLAEIEAHHHGSSDDEKGSLVIRTNDGSDGASPTEVLRTNSAGNLLITSSDQNGLTLNTTDSNGGFVRFQTSGTDKAFIGTSHHLVSGGSPSEDDTTIRAEGVLQFTTGGGTERVRITTDALHFLTSSMGDISASAQEGVSLKKFSGQGLIRVGNTATGGRNCMEFFNGNGQVGTIATSSSATAYNTSSDHRLKENVSDISDGITRVKQLQPKRFNWIADESNTAIDGFLAHEAATVVPEAVTGTKDAVQVWKEGDDLPDGVSAGENKLDDDGNTIPELQGIDQSKLVPLLTAALQEAIAKIETLETKVAALEAE